MAEFNNSVPPYMKRAGFKPSKPEDSGDGGAFPEIHYAHANSLSPDENAKKIVYSQHSDHVAKEDGMDLDETTQQTNAALEQIVNVRLSAYGGGSMLVGPDDPRFFGDRTRGPGFPGGLPGVPPGARFDPYGPPNVPGFEPGRFARNPPRSGGGIHPDLEHFHNGSDFI